jgi:hypothetical protein
VLLCIATNVAPPHHHNTEHKNQIVTESAKVSNNPMTHRNQGGVSNREPYGSSQVPFHNQKKSNPMARIQFSERFLQYPISPFKYDFMKVPLA